MFPYLARVFFFSLYQITVFLFWQGEVSLSFYITEYKCKEGRPSVLSNSYSMGEKSLLRAQSVLVTCAVSIGG